MYIELFTDIETYRGELSYMEGDSITFVCGITNVPTTVLLCGAYSLYQFENVDAAGYLHRLEHIVMSKIDPIFTVEDRILIANANDVIKIYHILHSLRSLEFSFNNINDLKIADLRSNIINIVNIAYSNNKIEIEEDEELTTEEKTSLISTMDRSREKYFNIINNTNDVKMVLSTFPPMFNEKLLYLSELVNYINQHDSTHTM